jgi:predicted transcriptional regulator
MRKKQIIVDIDADLKDAVKDLANEFDVSMKYLIRKALIDLLMKHNKPVPVDEL